MKRQRKRNRVRKRKPVKRKRIYGGAPLPPYTPGALRDKYGAYI
jgi:hypothetical protein